MGLYFRQYPFALQGILVLGGERLRELAASLGVSLQGVPASPGAVAGAILKYADSPEVLRAQLTPIDLDRIGVKLGVGTRAGWRKKNPDYDAAVLARLFEENALPPVPPLRTTTRHVAHVAQWEELRSLKVWSALDSAQRRKCAQALVRAMGAQFKLLDFVGAQQLARVWDDGLKVAFVAVPGGHFVMGLADAEKKALARLTKTWSEEARMHVRDLAEIARPAHEVTLAPFLCAQMPLTRAHGKKFQETQVVGGMHKVCLYDADGAAKLEIKSGARLLTEAEWEYVARAGGARTWLCGERDVQAYASAVLSAKLNAGDEHPFGIYGLGWGSWVEDSWHNSYRGAPSDGSAWEPRTLPQVARGGAFLVFPWQMDGEVLLLCAAHRERGTDQHFPVMLARDLPARRGK